MRRSELYEKVWNKPMIRLARELGISDVGLAKACRRHSVPVPPRGYWNKVQAGQNPPKTPLLPPERNVAVDFATTDPEERARQQAAAQQQKEAIKAHIGEALRLVEVDFPEQLNKPHPLVAATRRYCEKVPCLIERYKRPGVGACSLTRDEDRPPFEQHGRSNFFREGHLDITALLKVMDWAWRFHDAVLRALIAGGMKIQWCPAQAVQGSHH